MMKEYGDGQEIPKEVRGRCGVKWKGGALNPFVDEGDDFDLKTLQEKKEEEEK